MCFVNVFIGFAVIAIFKDYISPLSHRFRPVGLHPGGSTLRRLFFSLATETLAREKLQPLRGRALSKTSIIIA